MEPPPPPESPQRSGGWWLWRGAPWWAIGTPAGGGPCPWRGSGEKWRGPGAGGLPCGPPGGVGMDLRTTGEYVTWGRGVAGVWGNCRRPLRGVLVPEVDGTGLPLTELLPYTKSEIKQIKKTNHKFKDTTCRTKQKMKTENKTNREGVRGMQERQRKPNREAREDKNKI